MATLSYDVRRFAMPVAAMLLLTACSGGDESSNATRTPSASPTTSAPTEPSPTATPTPTESETTAPEPKPAPYPVSLPAYFEREPDGGDLRLGAVRERTAAYTSYDASYRSGHLRVTGVLNIPTGKGPFPTVVLAHGYIDPAMYISGETMTRERDYLARQGYVTLHIDYRNHAQSSKDPGNDGNLRNGYTIDAINAALALKAHPAVDPERVALIGRSMGGGVVYNAIVAKPGVFQAAVAYAPVSSDRSTTSTSGCGATRRLRCRKPGHRPASELPRPSPRGGLPRARAPTSTASPIR